MKKSVLIHNPTSGNGDHSKDKLKELIRSAGYEVDYYSTDVPGWERFLKKRPQVIFVAGGDGTVQKVAQVLRRAEDEVRRVPVQVLPLGTANNISETLGLRGGVENLLQCDNLVGFDVGEVRGAGEVEFFIEGLGLGIFPKLIKVMEAKEEAEGEMDPQEELQRSLRELLKIVSAYEACEAVIIADKEEITGKFLLLEIMNIRFIGPNIELAPNANTDDGFFDLVAISEDSRELLQRYIANMLEGNERENSLEDFSLFRKVKELRIKWQGTDVHIDDESLEDFNGEEIIIKNRKQTLNFRTP